jgi:hypothetical protein
METSTPAEGAKPPSDGVIVVTMASPMLQPYLGTAEAVLRRAEWGEGPYGLLTLVDPAPLLTYEPDLDGLAVSLVEMATKLEAYRTIIAMPNESFGEQVAERLRQHPMLDGWMEIRPKQMPRASRYARYPLIVMGGDLGIHGEFSLPGRLRESLNVIGRYGLLATAGGLRDLAAKNERSEGLFYQLSRAILSGLADSIILLGETAQEEQLYRAVWQTRQMIENVPIDFGTVGSSGGAIHIKKLYT